jgi:hypothetical protein
MSKEKYIKAQVTVECFFKTDKLQNIEEIKSYVQSVLNNHLNEEWQTMITMPNWDSFKITKYDSAKRIAGAMRKKELINKK